MARCFALIDGDREMQEIRLNSNSKFLAPYAMKNFMAYYKDENDAGKKELVEIVRKMWGIPGEVAADLLSGALEWWREEKGMQVAFYVNLWSYGGWAYSLYHPKTSY